MSKASEEAGDHFLHTCLTSILVLRTPKNLLLLKFDLGFHSRAADTFFSSCQYWKINTLLLTLKDYFLYLCATTVMGCITQSQLQNITLELKKKWSKLGEVGFDYLLVKKIGGIRVQLSSAKNPKNTLLMMAFWGLLLVINSADKSRWCTTHAMQLLVYHKATAIMQGSLGPRLLNSLTEYQLVVKHELLGIICFDDHNKTFRPWNDILQCLICWTCLRITQNVAFEFFNLGIFHQLLSCQN